MGLDTSRPATPLTSASLKGDEYLNKRNELRELLEALAAAGLYAKAPIARGERSDLPVEGTLFTPTKAFAFVSPLGLYLGGVKVANPIAEQLGSARHADTVVAAPYGYVVQPAWWPDVVERLPALHQRVRGGVAGGLVQQQRTKDSPPSLTSTFWFN